MLLQKIDLINFRSYNKNSIQFSPAVTCIIGRNASGKTNIIEAIYLLSTGKSFRAKLDADVISWGREYAKISAQLSEIDLSLFVTQGWVEGRKVPRKKYTVNGVSRRALDFVGNLKTVLFWPEDLDLVTGSPSLRRRLLDGILLQVDREYRRSLSSYERGLRARNNILTALAQGVADRSQLFFWDELLIKNGGYITDRRAQLIDYINQSRLSELSFRIEYDKSVISKSRLVQYEQAEVAAKTTLVGPQRDDIIFKIINPSNNTGDNYDINKGGFVDLHKFGSRGEQRLAILWLKLAELNYVQQLTGDRPILLLDDIFSELDYQHQLLVMEMVKKQQTVITTTDRENLAELGKAGIGYETVELGNR